MNNFIEIPATKNSLGHRRPIHGLGINDAWYMTQSKNPENGIRICPYYKAWKSMLERCYCAKYQERRPTYKGCTVSEEWLTFSNFRSWMEKQDWKGKCLDKDIIKIGNKIYSKDNCVFVSEKTNNLLNEYMAKRGDYPRGVSSKAGSSNYDAYCCVDGKNHRIGSFKNITDASIAYLKFKSGLIVKIANEDYKGINDRVMNGLISHANRLMLQIDCLR
jgi:hypothetical protein